VGSFSPQAKKRRMRRLRRNTDRLVGQLYTEWMSVAGKEGCLQAGCEPATYQWEQTLHQLFVAECQASGRGEAAQWLVTVVRAAAALDVHFYADMVASAMSVGVFVPMTVTSVRTLGPSRRSPVVPNALRVAWSRASTR